MYCNEDSPVPICCQKLKSESEQPIVEQSTQKQEELQAVEDFFNDDHSSANKQEEASKETAECPKNSLVVLNEDGEPTSCSSESECPQVCVFDLKYCSFFL